MRRAVPTVLSLVLATSACGPSEETPVQAERISLDAARAQTADPDPSPDTEDATWTVSANGQAINFGNAGEAPLMSLACDLRADPPTLRVIRHAKARPGLKALFPVIGNGTISRFKLDAALNEGEWRWEGKLDADDASLDVFTGRRELEATLPGNGSLLISGSAIPGEFVRWCRAGGKQQRPASLEQPDDEDDSADAADGAEPID